MEVSNKMERNQQDLLQTVEEKAQKIVGLEATVVKVDLEEKVAQETKVVVRVLIHQMDRAMVAKTPTAQIQVVVLIPISKILDLILMDREATTDPTPTRNRAEATKTIKVAQIITTKMIISNSKTTNSNSNNRSNNHHSSPQVQKSKHKHHPMWCIYQARNLKPNQTTSQRKWKQSELLC